MDRTHEFGGNLAHPSKRPSLDGVLTKDQSPLLAKADPQTVAEQGVLSGYGSLFWVVDSYAECTAPGAFSRTITERGPNGANRIFLRMEHYETCGVWTELKEDATGLYGDAFIKDDGQFGTKLRNHLADPHPLNYGLSIGYRVLGQRPATVDDPLDLSTAPGWVKQLAAQDIGQITVLTEIKLMEISAVTFPAVDPAVVDSYRSDAYDGALHRVLASVKAGTLTPTQIGLLREIAAALPAERAPESGQEPPQPGAKSDSDDDALFAELDLTLALFERTAA